MLKIYHMRIQKDNELLRKARALFTFRNHMAIYLLGILFLWFIWMLTGSRYRKLDWPLYIAAGWGFVLLVHFIIVNRKFSKKNL